MGAGLHAGGGLGGGKAGAEREPAADALGDRHDIGCDARPFMGKKLAGAAHAGLDLVEDQQQAVFVADLAQRLHELGGSGAHTALALHRLDEDCRRRIGDGGADRCDITESYLIETRRLGAEAFEIFLLAAGGDRRKRAPMEGPFEGDDVEALGVALGKLIAARRLDRTFERFRT